VEKRGEGERAEKKEAELHAVRGVYATAQSEKSFLA
jgi:hypothetical protein